MKPFAKIIRSSFLLLISLPFSLISVLFVSSASLLSFIASAAPAEAAYHFADYYGVPPLHVYATTGKSPVGITPTEIKKLYHLPPTGGKGTIVIIGAYDDASIAQDLADFSVAFNLPACTKKNVCFTQHVIAPTGGTVTSVKDNSGWDLETALDVEWAHAIAPNAKILLVEAPTPSGANFLKAIDYAGKQKGASAISMSWGGAEFPEETMLDAHFKSVSNAPFFASSGDNGTGASWPASSPKVIGVGGTSLTLSASASLIKETAWQGSGGGVSAYEKAPSFQIAYSIPHATVSGSAMRAIPDVAYDADPATGFPVIHNGIWRTVGGTSAGAPQWAGIAALGTGVTNTNFYADKSTASNTSYFRDIVSGTNGACGYYCSARMRYDYVTGLGTPQTDDF